MITGKHETVYSFGWYLRKMIADTRAKGATPILLTLTKTNNWNDGRIHCDTETYRLWTWQTAVNEKVAFVDLTRIIADRFQREGPEAVTAQFIDDKRTPTSRAPKPTRATWSSALRAIKSLAVAQGCSRRRGRAVPADRGRAKRLRSARSSLVARKADHRLLRQRRRFVEVETRMRRLVVGDVLPGDRRADTAGRASAWTMRCGVGMVVV